MLTASATGAIGVDFEVAFVAGVSFTGTFAGSSLVLMVSDGECSDGMSDRTYPFHATLKLKEEVRKGCAWTDADPFRGPEKP